MRVAVLASGEGGNLQAILDASAAGRLRVNPVLVLSDVPAAPALGRAENAGVATSVIQPRQFSTKIQWNRAIADALEEARVELVVLAGFMRIIGDAVLEQFKGRIINVHPSLLPRYTGLDTYARVLAAGDGEHGASVHFVTRELDGGPVIAQAVIPITQHDDESSLRRRVQAAEHWLYPLVIAWFAAGRIAMRANAVTLDGRQLAAPVRFSENNTA